MRPAFALLLQTCLSALLALLAGAAVAASAELPGGFHRLPLDGALSQNTVTAILQDRRGVMWFGTLGGLNHYDGYRFRALSSDPRDPHALAGVSISALLEDRSGRIWIAGSTGWLDRLDPLTGAVTHVASDLLGADRSPSSAGITALHEDTAGDIWIGSPRGLHRWHAASGSLERDVRHDGAPWPGITAIASGDDGRLWLGSTVGVLDYDPATGTLRPLANAVDAGVPAIDARVTALRTGPDDSLWIGTVAGLYRWRAGASDFDRFHADPARDDALDSDFVRTLLLDRHGAMWVGTQSGGLSRFDGSGFRSWRHHPDRASSLSSNDVWSLFEDRTGLLWIGTAGGGLNQVNPSTRRFQALRSNDDDRSGLGSGFVWAVREAPDGTIWMATLAGLERWNPHDGRFTLHEPLPGVPAMNQLQALHVDVQGRIWAGSVNGRLYRFDAGTGRFMSITRPDGPAGAFSIDRIWFMRGDPLGQIWVGTSEGLFALDPDTGAATLAIEPSAQVPMRTQPIRTALLDSDGVHWFGGGGAGLIRYEKGRVTAVLGRDPSRRDSLSDNGVRALHEDAEGGLWVGTHNGLNHLTAADRRAGRNQFRLFTQADGLPNNTIYGIVPEGDGRHLWLATNAGLSRFDRVTGRFRNYTSSDGLTANEMNGGAELRSSDGKLYFGTVDGVSWFDPAALTDNLQTPAVAITAVEQQGRGERHALQLDPTRPLQFDHDRTAFTLHFAVMDFHQPLKNRFRYRLAGPGGNDWIETDQPSISFATLPAGEYRFELQGANNDGVWSAQPATLDIVVAPPWWRTPEATAAGSVLLLLAGLAYHRGQRRKLAREREFNEALGRAHSLAEARHQIAQRYARVDQLTQLPNRGALLDALGRQIRDARTRQRPLALLLVNLDRFQQINDSIGHALGDRVLQATAERLQRTAGADAMLARVGSDEFALVASPAQDDPPPDWPEQLAADLQHAIAEPHPLREPPLIVGASIGIACLEPDVDTPSDLLGRAGSAMHHAKRQATGGALRYRNGMRESVRERLSLETRMRRALDAGEFVAYYQPLVTVVGGRVSGFEALIRWLPPAAPPIYPDQFIPVAEESGLIVELGHWMLREACRQLAEWRAAGITGVNVAVNVSMRQLRSGQLVPHLRACLAEFGVPATMLKLEITESAMMENVEDTAEQLAEIRQLGVPVSIDDFGTGFSSLSHLKRLPVSELKIDRSFVADVAVSEQSRKIVASIIRLAHELNLNTVGEGVEDAASLACLREIGCDLAQGYHFAKPMSAAELWQTGWLQPRAQRHARA